MLDAEGEPEHEHGITAAPGPYFLGLRWQSRRSVLATLVADLDAAARRTSPSAGAG